MISSQSSGACFCRKAVKATLVLLPLLGITYMLFFVNPGEDDIAQIVFIYFNSFLQSFQVRKSQYWTDGGKHTQTRRGGAGVHVNRAACYHVACYHRAAELLPS